MERIFAQFIVMYQLYGDYSNQKYLVCEIDCFVWLVVSSKVIIIVFFFFTLTRSSWDQNESIKNQYFSFLRFYTKAAVCWRNQLYSKLCKIAILYDDHHPVLNVFFATDCLFWCAKLKNLFLGLAFNLFHF